MWFVWVNFVVLAGRGRPEATSAGTMRTFCGRILPDACLLYCYGVKQISKRYGIGQYPEDIQMLDGSPEKRLFPYDDEESVWTWLAGIQMSAFHMLTIIRAKRNPGLVDEYYFKTCHISDLMN